MVKDEDARNLSDMADIQFYTGTASLETSGLGMKTLVGIPCGDSIKIETAFSLLNLKGDWTPMFQRSIDVAHNRNIICQSALDRGFSHLLFVDADVGFNSDALQRMLAHDKDIIGLAYNHRRLPLETVVRPLDGDIGKPLPKELFECASVGTGTLLIKTSVLDKLGAPWFEFIYDEQGRVSEDVNFCRKARSGGYKIWIDPTIPIVHCGEYLY